MVLGGLIAHVPVTAKADGKGDWLLTRSAWPAKVTTGADGTTLVLSNGLAERRFTVGDGAATTSLREIQTGEEFVRAVEPEATFDLDGKSVTVGGMQGQQDRAFLNEAQLKQMSPIVGDFRYKSYRIEKTVARFGWTRMASRFFGKRSKPSFDWQPKGVRLVLEFTSSNDQSGLMAEVAYELYDDMPVFSKQVTLRNQSQKSVRIDGFQAERLAIVEPESSVDLEDQWQPVNMTVLTDYTFAGQDSRPGFKAIHWETDSAYTTQVNYELKTPCLLSVRCPVGPGVDLAPGQSFSTFHVFELLHDSTDRERKDLQIRKLYRALAPWCQENPIMLHLTSSDPSVVKTAIDQASECGFEMIVISFWSGLDMEDVSEGNLTKWRGLVDYAHSKGLLLGGYSLLASRSISAANDVIDPKTNKPGGAVFGSSPCLGSQWGRDYFAHIKKFIEATGFDLLEHDGSYPGDVCASTSHPGHKGLEDSQWTQFQTISDFYHWCRQQGVFLNVPDNYFLQGSNKTGMGYRETNWSLPRALQHIHARQNLYDGTWLKPPTMGWMMVPLVEYQGGGPAATIEPLHEHLSDYEMHLANNFGYGAQACYRGPRIYDTPEVRTAVQKWVAWFKEHREVLESDVIHLRRADGRAPDAILHANPFGREKGMLVIWNPADHDVQDEMTVPLYYTGLTKGATVVGWDGTIEKTTLARDYSASIRTKVPAHGMAWYVIR